MIVFPNAKINIGLDILEKRADGFHEISTVFYPVKIYDALEIIPDDGEGLRFSVSGDDVPSPAGDHEDNLCVKAYRLLDERYGLPPAKMHLHKNIPTGAGLGGGSSDAAFTLRLLNELAELELSPGELEDCARELGADCAFFIGNEPMYAFGKGDKFSPVELDLSEYYLVVAMPGFSVSTARAYAAIQPLEAKYPLKETCELPVETWQELLKNDFEPWLFREFPEIATLKHAFYDQGAVYASVSGSGAAVYGIFYQKVRLPALEKGCRVFYDVR